MKCMPIFAFPVSVLQQAFVTGLLYRNVMTEFQKSGQLVA